MNFKFKLNLLSSSVLALVGVGLLYSTMVYTVPETDRCFVTQFQKPINVNDGPVGSGMHFKLPLIQNVDCIQVSRSTDKIGSVPVTTKDTFTLTMYVGVTTEIPDSSVYRLLYQTGKQGSGDISANINPNIVNTLRNILGKHDLMQIAGEDRETTLGEFKTAVQQILEKEWGITVKEVQVNIEQLPQEYMQRMTAAQSARATIVLAQRQQEQAKIEAETKVTVATGEANFKVVQADGDRRKMETLANGNAAARLLEAQAEATAIKEIGAAKAEAAARMADALVKNSALVQLTQAERWDGKMPTNMYSSAPVPFLNLDTTHK